MKLFTRDLLVAAAVIGHDCHYEWLCQVAGIIPGENLPTLDELLAGRLLVDTGAPTRPYALAHDKIRDVVYGEAGPTRRQLYHQQALTGIEATAPSAELAHHALAARLPAPAYRYSQEAGDAAMGLFAVRDAVEHYEQARKLLAVLDDHSTIAAQMERLYLRLGRAYDLLGNHQQAQAVYQEGLDLAQSSGWTGTVCLAYHTFDCPATLLYSQRALELARKLENQELIARSLNMLAYAEILLGRVTASQGHMKEARDLYAKLGNRALEADCLTIIV